jgi:D-isomer specific 2-hydroxyacid dehydrogenase, NAD binding domain
VQLSERTRGLIGKTELGLMKASAHLINTSRGPIVDEAAFIPALREKRVAGAGLDVFEIEPLPIAHPFRKLDNVILRRTSATSPYRIIGRSSPAWSTTFAPSSTANRCACSLGLRPSTVTDLEHQDGGRHRERDDT